MAVAVVVVLSSNKNSNQKYRCFSHQSLDLGVAVLVGICIVVKIHKYVQGQSHGKYH